MQKNNNHRKGEHSMYEILGTNSPKWNEYIKILPQNLQDIYFTSEYYKLCEENDEGIGSLFVYREKEKVGLYPYLINEIKGYALKNKYYDIEAAYGYGGPLVNSMNKEFLLNFEDSFLQFCKENNIVAEFIRFHPFIKNENIFKKNINVILNRKIVYIDLTKSENEIWEKDISSKNRNMIRKAEKSGLKVYISKDYHIFKSIYDKTMDKVKAGGFYYFNEAYYEKFKEYPNFTLLSVLNENNVIAAGVFMNYGEYFHYHLSGSVEEYLKYAPNNLMLWEAIKNGKEKGAKLFNLGGGLSNDEEDSLFKFKSSFSKAYSDFYIGKRVHNNSIYEYLIGQWEKKHSQKAQILLQYKS